MHIGVIAQPTFEALTKSLGRYCVQDRDKGLGVPE